MTAALQPEGPTSERHGELPRRGPWLALLSVLVIGAMPWLACPRLERYRATTRAEEALGALSACLYGADADRGDERLRLRALSGSLAPRADPWPERCAIHTAALEVSLKSLRDRHEPNCDGACCVDDARCVSLEQMRAVLDAVRIALLHRRFGDGMTASLFEHASALGLQAPAANVPPPPEPAQLFAPEKMTALVRGGYATRAIDAPAGGALALSFERAQPIRCALSEAGKARCRRAPASPTGDEASNEPALPEEGEPSAGPVALGDALAWSERNEDGSHTLRLKSLGQQRSVTVGRTPPIAGQPQIAACADGKHRALMLRAPAKGYDTPVTVARYDGSWRVESTTVPSTSFGFTCAGADAHLTWFEPAQEVAIDPPPPGERPVSGSYRIARLSCHGERCQREQADVSLQRHRRDSRYFVASLGERVLLLWRSPHGDVRMRLAALDELADARDVALFDDTSHGGFAWEQAGTALVVRGEHAFVLVETSAGPDTASYAFIIGKDGATPVTLTK